MPAEPEPDPHVELGFERPSLPPAYYRRDSCQTPNGCTRSQTVTIDRVETRLACGHYQSIAGGRRLRALVAGRVEVRAGELDRAIVRRVLVHSEHAIEACFAAANTAAELDLELAISAGGIVVAVEGAGAWDACIRAALAASSFPGTTTPTRASWRLSYTIVDPTTIPPLTCAMAP